MKAIQIISQDLFDKIRSRFQNLEMGDETGAVTIDPSEARFFDFDFVNEGNDLGRVSISLNDLGSLKIYYSQGITENQDSGAKQVWYNFLKEMRQFAMRRLLRFDTRDIAKTNLDKNDFQHLAATQGPKDEDMTNTMNESRWSQKSTKKTSRAVKGSTEVIVRHTESMDEMYPGARSQPKKIKAIFIQNKDGERFKYPFIHPAGAFAMAQHVDHGGAPYDPAGKAIIQMSEHIAQLQAFQRKIQRASLHDDAMGITERAVGRLQELKAQIEALSKRHHYESWMAEFNEQENMDSSLQELDAVTMEDYKQKFTQTSFQEELSSFFPLLHKIMSEANKVDLEDYVKEAEEECEKCHCDPCECDKAVKESEFNKFSEWAEAVEQGKLTDDQIASLKQALADLPEGQLDLDTAYNFFNEFGIDDGDLEDKFQQAKELDSTTDPISVFQLWAKENYPELLVALGMSNTDAPAEPEPETPPAGENTDMVPPPGAMEEGFDPAAQDYSDWLDITRKETMRSGETDGANSLEIMAQHGGDDITDVIRNILSYVKQNSQELGREVSDETGKTVKDAIIDIKNKFPQEYQAASQPQGMAEGEEGKDSMIKQIAEIVKSRFNKDNPEVGPFNGHEGILIDVEKQIGERYGEAAGAKARQVAEAFMEKLSQKWQQKHGHVDTGDGLSIDRLKELLGNVKAKVEAIDPNNPRDYEIPAYQRKEKGQAPLTPKDVHDKDNASPTTAQGLSALKARLGQHEDENPQHSHQYKTTMKHADNPTYQQRMAAHDIKPGIKGYQDRIDLLKDLERTGKLKKEDVSAFEDIMKLAGLK